VRRPVPAIGPLGSARPAGDRLMQPQQCLAQCALSPLTHGRAMQRYALQVDFFGEAASSLDLDAFANDPTNDYFDVTSNNVVIPLDGICITGTSTIHPNAGIGPPRPRAGRGRAGSTRGAPGHTLAHRG
jgi:hypothetical protein